MDQSNKIHLVQQHQETDVDLVRWLLYGACRQHRKQPKAPRLIPASTLPRSDQLRFMRGVRVARETGTSVILA